MAVLQPSISPSLKPHLHVPGEECPWCEQPIPNEKLEEVNRRIAAKERQRQAEADVRLRSEIEAVRKQGQAALEAAKTEALANGRKVAEAEFNAKLTEATEAARQAAERDGALAAELATTRLEKDRLTQEAQQAIEAAKTEAATREAAALETGRKAAETALKGQLDQAAVETTAAREQTETLKVQLREAGEAQAEVVRTMKAEMQQREQAARQAGTAAAEEALRERMTETETARKTAETRLAEVEAAHETALNARLQEQRGALEKDRDTAVNVEKAKAFEERQKLESAVQDLQRKLEKKSNEELGEGAEVDLFEELKAAFPGDLVTRVAKGSAGADIIHEVKNNGQLCGRIVYDAKNRTAWRTDYVTKLKADQIAAEADHAVLASRAFPAGANQVTIVDGVIVANPARALVIAEMLRKQVVQTHGLRISNEERQRKTETLYAFITSERCRQFLDDIHARTEDMEELDVQEKKAHEKTWKKRGELIRVVQRSRGQLTEELERIIGTGQ